MRLWHVQLLPYLPDAQFKGQLRELIAIKRDWERKGTTNHLLINKVMEYDKGELFMYFVYYAREHKKRFDKFPPDKYKDEFLEFCNYALVGKDEKTIFDGWHNKEYLRICLGNLYEKHKFGIGKSRITDEEWARLCEGYEKITGEKYQI